jgi:hypothetical protein
LEEWGDRTTQIIASEEITVESFQPILSYLGIGIAVVADVVVILWLIFSIRIFAGTQGIPKAITNFFMLSESFVGFR